MNRKPIILPPPEEEVEEEERSVPYFIGGFWSTPQIHWRLFDGRRVLGYRRIFEWGNPQFQAVINQGLDGPIDWVQEQLPKNGDTAWQFPSIDLATRVKNGPRKRKQRKAQRTAERKMRR